MKSAPDVLERLRAHRRVAHRVGDRGMPQEVLEPPCVHSPGRQCVSGRMPQHVDMHRERQPGSLASPLDHASNAHAAEGLTALIDEDVGPLGPVFLLLPPQELETVHLIPLKVMDAISAALEPANDDGAFRQIDVIPAQIACLRDPQPVTVDDQPDQPIPMTMPVAMRPSLPIVLCDQSIIERHGNVWQNRIPWAGQKVS